MTDQGIAEQAGKLFDGGLNCAQAVLQATTGNADERFMRLAKGFGHGMGSSGCLCGAIAGGVMALGWMGRAEAAGELMGWFKGRFGSSCCRVLTRGARREHGASCRQLTLATAAEVARLLRAPAGSG